MTTGAHRNTSEIMRRVHSTGTTPELALRKALRAAGVRFRVSPSTLAGKPDIVLPKSKLAIFVDGDFWHGNQWRLRNLKALQDQFESTTTRDYWLQKIRRNMFRDCAATAFLLSQGWTVIRFWESELNKDIGRAVQVCTDVIKNGAEPHPDSLVPQRTVAEFFAGIGLMRMGLERQGWTVKFANDSDPQKFQMYKTHYPDAHRHYVFDDIRRVPTECVPTVTLATASFPCNDLSLAGSRNGLSGEQSSTFWSFVRILDEMKARRPPLVLIENVVGFITSHGGADFKDAMLALNRLGYTVDPIIVNAASFVPQSRQRVFVVGQLLSDCTGQNGETCLSRPHESAVRPRVVADFIASHPDIRWSNRDLPPLAGNQLTLQDILEDLPDDSPVWWRRERSSYLVNQMSPRHRATAEKMIAGRKYSFGTVFRRIRNHKSMAELRTDGLAGCLRTPRGGSGRQILFKAGEGQYFARLLTPRECARLMGADEYEINCPLNQALFGFGDAVCVPVVEWIAEHYLNPLVSERMREKPLCLPRSGAL